jgi:hypothetical protein
MRIALAQLNPTVGDLTGNVDRMTRAARDAAARGAEAVVFPELSITGYPPRDLVEKPSFLEAASAIGRSPARQPIWISASSAATWRVRRRRPASALNGAALIGMAPSCSGKQDAAAEHDVFDRRATSVRQRRLLHRARRARRAHHLRRRLERSPFLEERLYQRDPVRNCLVSARK